MGNTLQRKQAAMAAVAKYAKKVDVVIVEAQIPRRSKVTPPRLRFDRVVLRVFERLRTALRDEVPSGVTVVVTITAPILVPGKTIAAVEERIRALLGKRSSRGLTETVHGNEVRIGIIRRPKAATAPIVGFVHNRDSDRSVLFDVTEALVQGLFSIKGRSLAVAMEDEPLWADTYRHVCDQVFAHTDFKRVFLVTTDGEVSTLVSPAD
jgi:hypothetical protein